MKSIEISRNCKRAIDSLQKSGWWINPSELKKFNQVVADCGGKTVTGDPPVEVVKNDENKHRTYSVRWFGPTGKAACGGAILAKYELRQDDASAMERDPELKGMFKNEAGCWVGLYLVDSFTYRTTSKGIVTCVEDWQDWMVENRALDIQPDIYEFYFCLRHDDQDVREIAYHVLKRGNKSREQAVIDLTGWDFSKAQSKLNTMDRHERRKRKEAEKQRDILPDN